MAANTTYIRVDVHAKRNPALTFEQFQDHWTNVTIPMALEMASRYPGIKKLTTFITTPELRAMAASNPSPMMEYDGHAELTIDSMETAAKMRQDPFYIEKVQPDEQYLLDMSTAIQNIGFERVWLDRTSEK